jgi:hypothetical protein
LDTEEAKAKEGAQCKQGQKNTKAANATLNPQTKHGPMGHKGTGVLRAPRTPRRSATFYVCKMQARQALMHIFACELYKIQARCRSRDDGETGQVGNEPRRRKNTREQNDCKTAESRCPVSPGARTVECGIALTGCTSKLQSTCTFVGYLAERVVVSVSGRRGSWIL